MPKLTEASLADLKELAGHGMYASVIASMGEMAAKTGTINEFAAALSEHMVNFLACMLDKKQADEMMEMIKAQADKQRSEKPAETAGVPSDAAMLFSKAAHQMREHDEQPN